MNISRILIPSLFLIIPSTLACTPETPAPKSPNTLSTDKPIEKKEPLGEANNMLAEPRYITVQHCLIGFRGSVPGKSITRSKEEAQKLAEELLQKAKSGADFAEIIQQHTDDSPPGIYKMANRGVPSMSGTYARDGMVPAFGDTGFPLDVGAYGLANFDPQSSPYGWHIVKRIE